MSDVLMAVVAVVVIPALVVGLLWPILGGRSYNPPLRQIVFVVIQARARKWCALPVDYFELGATLNPGDPGYKALKRQYALIRAFLNRTDLHDLADVVKARQDEEGFKVYPGQTSEYWLSLGRALELAA